MAAEGGGGWRQRRRLVAVAISLAVHSLLFLVVVHGTPPRRPPMASRLILLPVPTEDAAPYRPAVHAIPRWYPGAARVVVPPRAAVLVPPETTTVVTLEPEPPAPVVGEAVGRSPVPRIVPGPGDGRLWVRPLPLPPRELAKRIEPGHVELVDSAVTAIVQAYLDSIAQEPGAGEARLPEWTTTVEGAKFGLDGKNLYIAGLRIPAAVLALLPLPGGNQQAALNHQGEWIAQDLRQAARRGASLEDFKQAIRELRMEKERQRELERAQRTPADSVGAP